ncbi:MAG: hypothetical protein FJ044_02630 [Candidatus Cloacimonetes bacterium]|nr:hypothetical protein [Candidatus Cloacimonadota bacterium]
MNKSVFAAILAFVLAISFLATPALADGEVQKQILPTSPFYFFVKVKETVQQLLTFNQNAKTEALEKFSEQRVKEMQYAVFVDDEAALNASLDRYQAQKTKVLGQVKGVTEERVVEEIKQNTIKQQQEMTQMQLAGKDSPAIQKRIVEVQKEVAGEIKRTVEIVQGTDEAAEMEDKIHYVWLDPNADASGKLPPLPDEIGEWEYAPGTEGRDNTGKVVEVTFAPGTKAGGETGNKVEIVWETKAEGTSEESLQSKEKVKVVVEEDTKTATSTGEIKKIEIKQAPGTGGNEGKKVEVEIKNGPKF